MRIKVNAKVVWFISIVTACVVACSDFIEESIQEKTVTIISPLDGTISAQSSQTFWWEELNGALKYRLQVVSNKFDSVPVLRLDTVVSKNMFTRTLAQGRYQWRVQGLNGSSKTELNNSQNLIIDTPPDSVKLLSPTSGATASSPVTLTWQGSASEDVSYYEIYIYKDNVNTPFSAAYNPYSTKDDPSPSAGSHVFSAGASGNKIIWKVRAVDKVGNKSSSEKTRSFTIQ